MFGADQQVSISAKRSVNHWLFSARPVQPHATQ